MTIAGQFPFVDIALSKRLERAEAQSNVEAVEVRAALQPQSGATWIEVAGTFAMYDLQDSPLTQTFCLGMSKPVEEADLVRIEQFFELRNARVYHEVSPLADANTLTLLNARGYKPVELTSVMYRPLLTDSTDQLKQNRDQSEAGLESSVASKLITRAIAPSESELWARTAATGWSDYPEYTDLIYDLGLLLASRSNGCSFLAELDGVAVASAGLSICDGVALLAGASTIPAARGQGAQSALLAARLQEAKNRNCDLAMICAAPGSRSQRNAERNGFRIAYTRIKWMKG